MRTVAFGLCNIQFQARPVSADPPRWLSVVCTYTPSSLTRPHTDSPAVSVYCKCVHGPARSRARADDMVDMRPPRTMQKEQRHRQKDICGPCVLEICGTLRYTLRYA